MSGISDLAAAALANQTGQCAMLLRIAADPVARIWTGFGDFPVPIDAVETEADAICTGVGTLGKIPRLGGMINGQASRIVFSLSGVNATIVALADTTWTPSSRFTTDLGIVALGSDLQPVAGVAWIRRGIADQMPIKREARVRTIGLSVGFGEVSRQRPPLNFWNDGEQQRLSPGDKFCERTPLYDVGAALRWPNW